MSKEATPIYRLVDPGRGSFIPQRLEPIKHREENPKGTRHVLKTDQDHQHRDRRPRVQDWQRRLEKV